MNPRERFLAVMDYKPVDRVPNWEAGAWAQTRERWAAEGLDGRKFHWNWFKGEEALGMDPREFIPFHSHMVPPFPQEILEEDERTVVIRDTGGRVRRALKEGSIGGARMSMDQYLRFPVETMQDWQAMKKRYDPREPSRLAKDWRSHVERWKTRDHPLIFGPNCSTLGFYWIARVWMGTENLSYAWYDQPGMMHDMMEFWGDFLIEAARPVLDEIAVDYVCINEDMSMKSGPLLSPDTYRRFIFPHMKRVVEFCRSKGVRYINVDTDGNPEALVPLLMDAGVDTLWPLERAADQDPLKLRKKFGKTLRLWGGVDKRELAKGPKAIDAHLRTLLPLIEEGGFIPTVDHTVPPDISWPNFQYYLESKEKLLRGKL
ncbi:MAG: hypothetical protein NTW86_25790 [Candidatus Sumerlaeota bacterium]|nr:hypothetical protein [Candidatus Sumerlaeota bacterium]